MKVVDKEYMDMVFDDLEAGAFFSRLDDTGHYIKVAGIAACGVDVRTGELVDFSPHNVVRHRDAQLVIR